MPMTGFLDGPARRINDRERLGKVRRAPDLFLSLGSPRRGVACTLPGPVETHTRRCGAPRPRVALPIDLLLQPDVGPPARNPGRGGPTGPQLAAQLR